MSQSTSSTSEERVGVHAPGRVAEMGDQLLDLGLRVEDLLTDDRSVRGEGVGRAQHVAQDRVDTQREVTPAAPQAPASVPAARSTASDGSLKTAWGLRAPASRFREDRVPARRSVVTGPRVRSLVSDGSSSTPSRREAPEEPGAVAATVKEHEAGNRTTPVAQHAGMAALTLGALGVVFGDIGTSPLYALQTVFHADHGAVPTTRAAVYGVLSLVFWSITIIVSVKYVTFIMRADNDGEGGIMALIALIQRAGPASRAAQVALVALGHLRRGAVLRRRDDHAGDLGALGGRGPGGRRAVARVARRPDRAGDPHRAVRHPALRHRRGRAAVRAR